MDWTALAAWPVLAYQFSREAVPAASLGSLFLGRVPLLKSTGGPNISGTAFSSVFGKRRFFFGGDREWKLTPSASSDRIHTRASHGMSEGLWFRFGVVNSLPEFTDFGISLLGRPCSW